jgi:hypothetical protein
MKVKAIKMTIKRHDLVGYDMRKRKTMDITVWLPSTAEQILSDLNDYFTTGRVERFMQKKCHMIYMPRIKGDLPMIKDAVERK